MQEQTETSTTSGKWLVIDAHCHYLPGEAVAKIGVSYGFDYSAVIKGDLSAHYSIQQDIEVLLQVMDDTGVDMAVLNQTAFSALGMDVCKKLNNGFALVKRKYPTKFIMCGHVPLLGGQEAVNEIERCVNELGFEGMSLVSSLPDVTLDSSQLLPVYKKLELLGVPVIIHPTIRAPLWGGGKKYGLCWTVSREYEIAKATVEIMYGVLKNFPGLKFLVPHYGGGMFGLKGRLRSLYIPEAWQKPLSDKISIKSPAELEEMGVSKAFDELFGRLHFDMAGFGAGWSPVIKAALQTMTADRLCFGSDYPFEVHQTKDMRLFIDNIKQLDIPESDRRLMLGGNIKRLFKL